MAKPRTRVQRQCEICDKIFESTPYQINKGGGRFCSKACANIAQTQYQTIHCEHCGKEFRPRGHLGNISKFCSRECYNLSRPQHLATQTCEYCGKEFSIKKYRVGLGFGRFCSHECHSQSLISHIEKPCIVCGKVMRLRPSEQSRKYCSYKCLGTARGGENSDSWQGGTLNTYGLNWKTQRRIAYERDNGTCQNCGLTEIQSLKKYKQRCSVHHIEKRRAFRDRGEPIENANRTQNLIVLCSSCHPRVERGMIRVIQPKLL